MQCIVWTTCYFSGTRACFLYSDSTWTCEEYVCIVSQSDTSDNDIFASILLIFIIFPVSVMFVLVSTKTSQRLQHESEFRTQISKKQLEIGKRSDYDFTIPYLHVRSVRARSANFNHIPQIY